LSSRAAGSGSALAAIVSLSLIAAAFRIRGLISFISSCRRPGGRSV
jgi:hypothetical protein